MVVWGVQELHGAGLQRLVDVHQHRGLVVGDFLSPSIRAAGTVSRLLREPTNLPDDTSLMFGQSLLVRRPRSRGPPPARSVTRGPASPREAAPRRYDALVPCCDGLGGAPQSEPCRTVAGPGTGDGSVLRRRVLRPGPAPVSVCPAQGRGRPGGSRSRTPTGCGRRQRRGRRRTGGRPGPCAPALPRRGPAPESAVAGRPRASGRPVPSPYPTPRRAAGHGAQE